MDKHTIVSGSNNPKSKLPRTLTLRPPIDWERARQFTEHDPDGAEQFIALTRKGRIPDSEADQARCCSCRLHPRPLLEDRAGEFPGLGQQRRVVLLLPLHVKDGRRASGEDQGFIQHLLLLRGQ